MSKQESQKRGVRSESQKEMRARESYSPLPPSNEVRGAFGGHERREETDEDASLAQNVRATKKNTSTTGNDE